MRQARNIQLCTLSTRTHSRKWPSGDAQQNQKDIGRILSWHSAPILSKVTPATSHEPDWSILIGICDKLHIRMATALEMHKEETGTKSEESMYTAKKQTNLIFEPVSTDFFPFSTRELFLPSMLRNLFFWQPIRELFLIDPNTAQKTLGIWH